MQATSTLSQFSGSDPRPTAKLIELVLRGDRALFAIIVRRYNQRLYRLARAVLRNDVEAEDAVQDAYLRAFAQLAQLADPSRFVKWISRILLHEVWALLRRRRQQTHSTASAAAGVLERRPVTDPEAQLVNKRRVALLEAAIDRLPLGYRAVFMLREVEGMSVQQTAECLNLTIGAVKTRLHRARAALRESVGRRADLGRLEPFRIAGARCARIAAFVLARI